MPHVLIVDDEPAIRSSLGRFVQRLGHTVTQAENAADGVAQIERDTPDLVVTDMEMPYGTGFDVLEAGTRARVPIVILTGRATVEMAVEAMKRGAANFLRKPFTAETVAQMLHEAFEGRGAVAARAVPAPAPAPARKRDGKGGDAPPVGEDDAFKEVLEIVRRVADVDSTILITGESGTGKEVVARTIHNASERRDKAFVAVNCGGIPEQLLESELFGHVRGAFTGATQARRGHFALAEGGTLFLDEIGDMPLLLQVKLLRVLQDRQYQILGDSRLSPANVRFVAATHRDLDRMVAEGKFREDLYYRLNVVPLHLPPLRERHRDIPLLIDHFIREANTAYRRDITGMTPEVLELLTAYPWPGNIRELGNIIERMVVIRGSGVLDARDVPATVKARGAASVATATATATAAAGQFALPLSGIDLGEALQRYEGGLIEQALERTRGNRTQAAALLRINRTTLVEKLKRREGGDGSDEE